MPADNPSASAIKGLHDTTCETLSALKALGVDIESWDPLILHILIKKLDKGTHMQYEQSLEKPRELPTLKHFLGFLETKFQSLEAVGHRDRRLHRLMNVHQLHHPLPRTKNVYHVTSRYTNCLGVKSF